MTRRALGFFIAFLFVPFSVAKEKPPFPKMIVSAKYVLVTTYFGDNLADSRVPQADRQAVIDVQDTIRDWGRYTLVYERRGADLIILVRKAPSCRGATWGWHPRRLERIEPISGPSDRRRWRRSSRYASGV